jgi:hypothetical protein
MKRILLSIVLILNSIGSFCQTQEDCVFDSNSITDDFLKESTYVYSYKWDDEKKEGEAILNQGGLLHVKKWACLHYGTQANLFMNNIKVGEDLSQYLIKLSSIVGEKIPIEKVKSFLESEEISKTDEDERRYEFNLSDENYPEFFLHINQEREYIVFSIYYYRNV